MMENNGLTSDSNRLLQQSYLRSMSVVQQPSSSSGVESLVQKTQSLAMTTELVGTHSHSLFEENVGGTTYYFSPDENSSLEPVELATNESGMVQSSSKPPSQILSSGRDVHSPRTYLHQLHNHSQSMQGYLATCRMLLVSRGHHSS